ncbi:MAG: hypothetical protein A2544_01965 [Candidatus Zambryskibacteria bacterium RIFOXYD2_FULL_43_10]|uniref:SMP-30/Gluconolactonase/LRE-like region domain-containing protein n=1 Tax=Candidatus Zambryskibacteria bacterium RIFOXYD2_FULL_43_10 TaxID=1802782 RepID=A0A1G2V704_9BACT|nr:MAG: hypothetical protein A2544_01965 [Candidatus Zambryskibacteria bacterium RIFOXYD2_FULL_43_10]
MNPEISIVNSVRAQLGEGPFWYDGALYWVDILEKKIYRHFLQGDRVEEMQLDYYVSAIAPRKKGGFILAMKNGFSFLSGFNGTVTGIIDPEADKPRNRFNDGKCDHAGRFWAGTMALDASPGQGTLYMLDTSCQIHKKYSPVTISNGICWSLDNKQMYYIDTPTQQILVFDFDLLNGEIRNSKALVTIDKDGGSPDGMTIDANGCLWIALWGGGAVICYDPKSNKFLYKIDLPVSQVSSCAFGGENLDELYITTAKADLLKKEQLAGALFKIKTGIQGLPTSSFNG